MEEKKARNTPGPWEVNQKAKTVVMRDGSSVASCGGLSDPTRGIDDLFDEQCANAQLISCTPEMLEALIDIVSSIRAIDSHHPDLDITGFLSREIEACDAVIKKARG